MRVVLVLLQFVPELKGLAHAQLKGAAKGRFGRETVGRLRVALAYLGRGGAAAPGQRRLVWLQ